jgi:ubiquitin fusion degradation protein 1
MNGMNGWGFVGGRGSFPQRFEEQYHCYSVAYADKAHLEKGDKILLPPSAFDTLARLHVDYPMLFKLENPNNGTLTHCGVLEFTAEEGSCYIPFWMMQNLLIEEGGIITVTNVSLPKATLIKLQPQHVDFLEISNPRAVLEHALRNFSCVTKGDVICVPFNERNYHLELKEVQPQDAACIIETDCNVEFDAPLGYKEPETAASSRSGSIDIPTKQRAMSSGCSSPTPSSVSGVSGMDDSVHNKGPRIVDGQIIRPSDKEQEEPLPEMLAQETGQTGVQPNAAIPVKAPNVDYWAINAGDGARLDGKAPAALKDKDGSEVDVRKLRAEAAARRAQQAQQQQQQQSSSSSFKEFAKQESAEKETNTTAPVSKRKSRVGSKYSRLKGSSKAFQGSANAMDENK